MIGVKFVRAVTPHGIGDTRLMPSEDAALAFVEASDGAAELYEFPAEPHAHAVGFRPEVTKPMTPAAGGKQSYRTKRG